MTIQISTSAPRFFGGHYDSVKQASVRDHIQNNLSKQKSIFRPRFEATEILRILYTARLRLDILLAGDVVVVDTQYYDGTLFHTLAESDFFSAISQLDPKSLPFEVRRRKTGLLGMIRKPFIFSTLPNDEVKSEVEKTISRVLAKKTGFKSARDAVKAYVKAVDTKIRPDLQQITDKMLEMDEKSPAALFVEWSPARDFHECRIETLKDSPFEFPVTNNDMANEVIKVVKYEIQGNWIRSAIWDAVRAFRQSPYYGQDKEASDAVDQTWAWVMKLFNRVSAYHHDCNCLDVGEDMIYAYTDTKADDEYRKKLTASVSKDIMEGLTTELCEEIANESWSEFFKRINSEPIRSALRRWRAAKVKSMSLPVAAQRVYLLNDLLPLATAIRESYKTIGTEGQVSQAALITAGEAITLIAGGALPYVFSSPGLSVGGIIIPVVVTATLSSLLLTSAVISLADTVKKAIGNPIEEYNLIQIGLKSTPVSPQLHKE